VKSHRHILAFVLACVCVLPSFNTLKAQSSKPLVEGVEVLGNRRLTLSEILSHIKTRPGETFSQELCERDLNALLALGLFDKLKTRVIAETGVRGGVVVIFEVVELPLIIDVKVTNLRGVDEPTVLKRFKEKDVNLVKGGVYDSVKLIVAERVLKEILDAHGWPNTAVDVRTGPDSSAMYLSLIFNVTYENN
jgi:outer membrane protein assembly factor BamA